MKIIRDLDHISPFSDKMAALTIGNFDGVHVGHQALLQTVKDYAAKNQLITAAITFLNTPLAVLRPGMPIEKIITTPHKVKLLEQQGIDLLILLEFTKEFSKQKAKQFLVNVNKVQPFCYLNLGYDGKIGHDREGNRETLSKIASEMGFTMDYMDMFKADDHTASSSSVKSALKEGDLKLTQKLLGRPYSICSRLLMGHGKGKPIGFPTMNIGLEHLCLPPLGVYVVDLIFQGKTYSGIANLGIAPTLKNESHPILEVHLLYDVPEIHLHEMVEVVFLTYLRPEKKFASVDLLKEQIANDVVEAKEFHLLKSTKM